MIEQIWWAIIGQSHTYLPNFMFWNENWAPLPSDPSCMIKVINQICDYLYNIYKIEINKFDDKNMLYDNFSDLFHTGLSNHGSNSLLSYDYKLCWTKCQCTCFISFLSIMLDKKDDEWSYQYLKCKPKN